MSVWRGAFDVGPPALVSRRVYVCVQQKSLWSPLSPLLAKSSMLCLRVMSQVGHEVAKQVFEEHIERLKAKEKERKHRDDDDEGGGKKKKRSSRCSGCGSWCGAGGGGGEGGPVS